tara:strand:- start:507 stop:641 length:135 start_codon:yes stop_codon:yes gene_type:complete
MPSTAIVSPDPRHEPNFLVIAQLIDGKQWVRDNLILNYPEILGK